MRTCLLLDGDFLCHRAFHAFGDLSFEGVRTGVLFGVLRDVVFLVEQFDASGIVFCFDQGPLKRREIFPEYKAKRREGRSVEEENARGILDEQVRLLRMEYLSEIGFSNVFFVRGYEADDVIAGTIEQGLIEGHTVIVSADADLYQLLVSPGVLMYNPNTKKAVNRKTFRRDKGIDPKHWAHVKALAGCASDNVPGVPGVGEKTAVCYLSKADRPPGRKRLEAIHSAKGMRIVKRNMELIRLPFPGLPYFVLREDCVTSEKWECFCVRFGLHSLVRSLPMGLRM